MEVNIGSGKVYIGSANTDFVLGEVTFGSAEKLICVERKWILFERFRFCEW